jgi:hypothetical protein
MRRAVLLLLVGVGLGYGLGFHYGKQASDADWLSRTVLGVAVDCYDKQGHLIPDDFSAKFGGVALSCGPGQIAKVHQAK